MMNSYTKVSAVLCVSLATAAGLGNLLKPRHFIAAPKAAPLEILIPTRFGDWTQVSERDYAVETSPSGAPDQPSIDSPYDDILMRSYVNTRGSVIQLALAYGRQQRPEIKIHRPELCYTAQGFKILSISSGELQGGATGALPKESVQMLAQAPGRLEAVSFWIRIGDFYGDNPWTVRFHIFREGLKGRIDDGILVRVSQIVTDRDSVPSSYVLQQSFITDMLDSLPISTRRLLVS